MKLIIAGAHGSVGQRLVLLALQSPAHHTLLGLDFSPDPAPSPYPSQLRSTLPSVVGATDDPGQPLPADYVRAVEEAKKEGRYAFERVDLREYEDVVRVLRSWIGNSDADGKGKGEDEEVGLATLAGIRNPGDGIVRTHNT